MQDYLLNAWYAAAWSHEVSEDGMLERTLLDRPVLLYRTEAGEAVAIGNRCPHRFAPLGMGKRFGDVVACPYHGLQFDASGACVHNPHGEGRIPARARVPAYPLVERYGLLWIWFGAAAADPSAIPDYAFHDAPDLVQLGRDRLVLPCHYELAADNLMDLSHAVFIHEKTFGTPDALQGRLTVLEEGDSVHANVWVADCDPVGAAIPLDGPGCPVDHWLDMQWRPASNFILKVGSTRPGRPRAEGIEVLTTHLLTPETGRSTHYFFSQSVPEDLPLDGPKRPTQRQVFETEDEPMLDAVQKMMGGADLWDLDPVLLPGDAGAVRVRRALKRLRDAEAALAAPAG